MAGRRGNRERSIYQDTGGRWRGVVDLGTHTSEWKQSGVHLGRSGSVRHPKAGSIR